MTLKPLLLLFGTVIASGSASAATVSVTGGFTSFQTPFVQSEGSGGSVLNGVPLCATAGCAVGGPASVTFSARPSVSFQVVNPNAPAPENVVRFVAAAPQEVISVGDEFLLGILTFTNGIWTSLEASFGFRLTTQSDDPAFDNKVLSDTLRMVVSDNTQATPEARADFVFFDRFRQVGSLRAFELADGGNTASARLFGRIGSLVPTRMELVPGETGGFVSPDTPDLPPIPLPATAWMLFGALGALGAVRAVSRRRPGQTSRPGSV